MNLKSLRIVELEITTYTIQLGVFPTVKEVRTTLYNTILINMYDFLF